MSPMIFVGEVELFTVSNEFVALVKKNLREIALERIQAEKTKVSSTELTRSRPNL
jgi:hypothetical protein